MVETAIERVQSGDIEAYETVVVDLAPRLRSWLAVRCPPDLEADELAHQAFIKAYRHLGSYTVGTNFRAWLWRIAHNLLLAECKRLRRRRRVELSGLDLALLEHRIERLEADDEEAWLRPDLLASCLAELGDGARRLLDLRYRDGVPVWVMAERLDRSPTAISKQLSLIRRRLRECIGQRQRAEEMP